MNNTQRLKCEVRLERVNADLLPDQPLVPAVVALPPGYCLESLDAGLVAPLSGDPGGPASQVVSYCFLICFIQNCGFPRIMLLLPL